MVVLLKRMFVFMLLVLAVATAWQAVSYRQFLQTPLTGAEFVAFEVKRGASLSRVAIELQKAGLIQQHNQFRFLAWRQGAAKRIQAGKYKILPGTLPADFLTQMVSGEVEQLRFTIIEGWTLKQLLAALAARDDLIHSLENIETLQQLILAKEDPAVDHWEGQFLPETYLFPSGSTDVSILKRAHQALRVTLTQGWADRNVDIKVKTPYEALIMASIVERETGLASERPEIAGVFDRRLRKRMKLQTDPTVIYGMGDRYKGNIRRRDLKEATPYNTYVIARLPPTPIAMPGKDAIYAVMHPAKGKSLYFVARGDGSHKFSDSLKQHQAAVRKYQLGK